MTNASGPPPKFPTLIDSQKDNNNSRIQAITMTQHRNSSKLFIRTVLLFAVAACMVLFGVKSSDESVMRGSNLRRAQATSRYLPTKMSRAVDEDSEEGVEEETQGAEETNDAKETKNPNETGDDGADEDEANADENSDDEDEAPEDTAKESPQQGGGLVPPVNSTSPPQGSVQATLQQGAGSGPPENSTSLDSFASTPQKGAGLVPQANPTFPPGGSQGGSPPVPPVGSASPFGNSGEPAVPTGGFSINPNTPPNQFGDTPFLGQGGGDRTTTTPPIGDMQNWITPMEPTDEEDEEPGYVPPLDNVGGQGGTLNQPGFPAGGNDFATPTNGQHGLDNTGSFPFSPPPVQGGDFNIQYGSGSSQYGNTQYGNSQFGNGGGQAPKKGGGLAGAWKNLKNQTVEQGKSSLGVDIKEEEAMEEEEQTDEMEGGSDDDNFTSPTEQSGSKPADADDEFEKMIEEAEGETSNENGSSKETKEDTFEDLDAEGKEEVADEELEEVEEELKEEEEVAAAAGGMGFLLAIGGMIFTAHQMSENPDGVYASVCRLAITISGVVVKIICMPCRKVIGTGNPHYATHMPISTSADYGMGGANAGFEMS